VEICASRDTRISLNNKQRERVNLQYKSYEDSRNKISKHSHRYDSDFMDVKEVCLECICILLAVNRLVTVEIF
jgi:hypothetical protein